MNPWDATTSCMFVKTSNIDRNVVHLLDLDQSVNMNGVTFLDLDNNWNHEIKQQSLIELCAFRGIIPAICSKLLSDVETAIRSIASDKISVLLLMTNNQTTYLKSGTTFIAKEPTIMVVIPSSTPACKRIQFYQNLCSNSSIDLTSNAQHIAPQISKDMTALPLEVCRSRLDFNNNPFCPRSTFSGVTIEGLKVDTKLEDILDVAPSLIKSTKSIISSMPYNGTSQSFFLVTTDVITDIEPIMFTKLSSPDGVRILSLNYIPHNYTVCYQQFGRTIGIHPSDATKYNSDKSIPLLTKPAAIIEHESLALQFKYFKDVLDSFKDVIDSLHTKVDKMSTQLDSLSASMALLHPVITPSSTGSPSRKKSTTGYISSPDLE